MSAEPSEPTARMIHSENAAVWGAVNRVLALTQEWDTDGEAADKLRARQVRAALGFPTFADGPSRARDAEPRSALDELRRLLRVVEMFVHDDEDPGTEALSAVYCARQTLSRLSADEAAS